jgi:hypothetical protein
MTRKIKQEPTVGQEFGPLVVKYEHHEYADNGLTATCSLLPDQNGLLYSINPPQAPEPPHERANCDIVLVIDVSGSMFGPAPLPDVQNENVESAGLSILDLVKHAALTIIETLGGEDRLGLVTFSQDAEVGHMVELPLSIMLTAA